MSLPLYLYKKNKSVSCFSCLQTYYTRRFKTFCEEHDVTEYSYEIGKLYADSVISPKTGKFSKERYHLQGRFIRLIDSYTRTGQFDFSTTSRSKVQPENAYYQKVYIVLTRGQILKVI